MARRTAPRARVFLPLVLTVFVLSLFMRGSVRAFLPAPDAAAPRTVWSGASGAAILAGAISPSAAHAELPPLEDLPLDEVAQTRTFGPDTDTFLGISFPVVLVALAGAVSWAAFWVTTSKPAKDDEGAYKTYIGGGELPPEGYTNPLDPRMSEDYAIEDEEGAGKTQAKKAATSAIV